jgi:predicted RNA-binding protein with TRAM domain
MAFERRGFRKKFFGFRSFPRPVNVGEEYDVEINEIGSKGDGIARVKNFVVFIPNVKRGEKMRIKIKEVRSRFAIGEKIEAKEAEVKEEKAVEQVAEEPAEEKIEKPVEETPTEAEEVKEEVTIEETSKEEVKEE